MNSFYWFGFFITFASSHEHSLIQLEEVPLYFYPSTALASVVIAMNPTANPTDYGFKLEKSKEKSNETEKQIFTIPIIRSLPVGAEVGEEWLFSGYTHLEASLKVNCAQNIFPGGYPMFSYLEKIYEKLEEKLEGTNVSVTFISGQMHRVWENKFVLCKQNGTSFIYSLSFPVGPAQVEVLSPSAVTIAVGNENCYPVIRETVLVRTNKDKYYAPEKNCEKHKVCMLGKRTSNPLTVQCMRDPRYCKLVCEDRTQDYYKDYNSTSIAYIPLREGFIDCEEEKIDIARISSGFYLISLGCSCTLNEIKAMSVCPHQTRIQHVDIDISEGPTQLPSITSSIIPFSRPTRVPNTVPPRIVQAIHNIHMTAGISAVVSVIGHVILIQIAYRIYYRLAVIMTIPAFIPGIAAFGDIQVGPSQILPFSEILDRLDNPWFYSVLSMIILLMVLVCVMRRMC